MRILFRCLPIALLAAIALTLGCRHKSEPAPPDHPRLTPEVTKTDVTFFSRSLNRAMPYRVVLPADYATAANKYPVVYLLHGGGGGFRDWSNYSDIASYAAHGFILVMPEGESSYYMNAADRLQDRFEDYIVKDLIADVEQKFPALAGREHRAIIGISMGGFGAIVLGLKHPELFSFAGGLSSALDVPTRPFSLKRISQWRSHRAIFGGWNGDIQRQNDPYLLLAATDPNKAPYLFLTCGEQEGLLPANRRFAALLERFHFQHEFHTGRGGHDWNQWNGRVPLLIQSLSQHVQ
jgi:putative tributyrin esterase